LNVVSMIFDQPRAATQVQIKITHHISIPQMVVPQMFPSFPIGFRHGHSLMTKLACYAVLKSKLLARYFFHLQMTMWYLFGGFVLFECNLPVN
jgi:hypothetical protein